MCCEAPLRLCVNKGARLLQSFVFFFETDSKRRNFCSVGSTKRILVKRIQVMAKGPPLNFFIFKRNIQNRTRLEGPLSILLKFPLVLSGVKRYIRTFDVISELYCF